MAFGEYLYEQLKENPDRFRKLKRGDSTIYVYMRRDRYFGWAIMQSPDGEFIIPAIGKLQYAVYFRNTQEALEVYYHPSKYAEPFVNKKAPLLVKLDGFWLMGYSLNNKILFRTRGNPTIGEKSIIDKVIHDAEFSLKEVERMIKDGYWPQFEVWGPRLKYYEILFGGTDIEKLMDILGYRENIIPNMLMIMDAHNKEYINDYEKVRKIAESYGVRAAPYLSEIGYPKKEIRLTPEEVINVMTYIQEFNEAHGGVETELESVEYDHPELGHLIGVKAKIPAASSSGAPLEGAVAHLYSGPIFNGFKIKPFVVMALDTFAKKNPPYERIKIEVFKVIGDQPPEQIIKWMRDCKYAGKGEPCLGRLVHEVVDYLAEDYGVKIYENGRMKRILPRKMIKGVWIAVRKYFAELIVTNFPEIASIDPSEMNKTYGFDGKLIGLILQKAGRIPTKR